jgi:hypothetical protein
MGATLPPWRAHRVGAPSSPSRAASINVLKASVRTLSESMN